MKSAKKMLALVLVLMMTASLFACGKKDPASDTTPTPTANPTDETPTPTPIEEKKPAVLLTDEDAIYDAALGEFAKYLEEAQKEVDNISLRYALEAIAEAKLLESGVYIPASSQGGMYAIGRVAPYTASPCLWGTDTYRFHNVVVASDPITPEDRTALKVKYNEIKGTGTYEEFAKNYLTEKGYTLKDTYTIGYSTDPATWDILDTYLAADAEAIVNVYDGLIEYDNENVMKPALAESWTISDDGLTYTFKIRQGATWVDSQGRYVGDVTAKDFVTGMQHCLDCDATSYLVSGVIEGAEEYLLGDITDFAQVGVKALDDYTLEYKLVAATPYFMTMMGYNPFAPLNEQYFKSKGGALGYDAWAEAKESGKVTYGTDRDNIAYCGPYLVTNYTEKNKIVFSANPSYWNKDNINIKTITWLYNDGEDATKAYKDMKEGVIDGCGLNAEAIVLAKNDGWFDKYHYVSATDATSYGSFLNLNRQGYALFNDPTQVVSGLTDEQKDLANLALQNVHFRRAIAFSYDRIAYNAQTTGDEVAALSVINSYTPGNFVALTEDVTVKINGTDTTFKAGTYYGVIMQAQLDADGVPMKVWDQTKEDGAGSSAGFDGWYNPANAKAELAKAIEDLGFVIDKNNPVHIELSYPSSVSAYANRANAMKKAVEESTDGAIIIDLLDCESLRNWYYDGYYCQTGAQCNYNIYDCSGWGPDYGDPQTYLNTFQKEIGDMIHCLGIY